jgi:uncharacterized protein YraI
MNVIPDGARGRRHVITAVLAAVLTYVLLLVLGETGVLAQADAAGPGTRVRVANTDGQSLNLRAGPSTDQPIVTKVASGETLTVTGPASVLGSTRWLPVRTAGGQSGWVSASYVIVVGTPTPTPTRVVEGAPTLTLASASPTPSERRDGEKGRPVEVEAKLKFPEVKGREQEITVWVTRNGAPVPGALVTLETSDGDDEEHFRQLDPTNNEGWTRREFDVRHEKGTVELQVEAVAPDGGEGRAVVTYFRR